MVDEDGRESEKSGLKPVDILVGVPGLKARVTPSVVLSLFREIGISVSANGTGPGEAGSILCFVALVSGSRINLALQALVSGTASRLRRNQTVGFRHRGHSILLLAWHLMAGSLAAKSERVRRWRRHCAQTRIVNY
jgi:hypothetical protein